MQLRKFLFRYVITLVVFLAIDSLWLGFIAADFYQQRIGHLMGPVNWLAALLFYLVYIGGILVFAVMPATASDQVTPRVAAVRGGLLGFVAYATYDLTNLATLRDWPVDMVIIDMAWGAVLTGSVAALSVGLCKKLGL
jgi:uncharacterized membrane protein